MMYHSETTQEFKQENIPLFDEMMISWNGPRPEVGAMNVYASVFLDGWTPWLRYGVWTAESQSSNQEQSGLAKVYQDAFNILDGKKASGFRIKVDLPMRLHVFTNGKAFSENISGGQLAPIYLKVEGLSQIALPHPRNTSICSPTSTAAVVRYLTGKSMDPLFFAERVKDFAFDIFGNWVLNVAESSRHLGPSWSAWVERLRGIEDIHKRLAEGTPVIVSVRGPLPGSARAYSEGHLIVVSGLDPIQKEVYCMDPAFETNEKTHVRYQLDDFLTAWERRGKVAYIFEKTANVGK